ncbi:MAG: amidase [Pseudomonadota bacterium]|nr:amidase [Pseudomonadota bacterium]
MRIGDYAKYDGLGLADLVAKKKLKPVELVEEAIFRAERTNPKLNAVVFKDYERAHAAATGKLPRGPFSGVPFFLKDIYADAQGMPTRQACAFMPPFAWDHDCELVSRFKKAGLIALGKTNVPEFGLVATTESKLYGPAHNPWNLAHSTGGSSGGSAALVAAGVVPMAHANDGGGSIRIPASCCGLVGLKPTRGRVSYAPDYGDVLDGLVNDHVLTRTVRDSAAVLDAIQGSLSGDPYWAPPAPESYLGAIKRKPKRLRIAFTTKKLDGGSIHADCVAAVKAAAKLCEAQGHIVEEAVPSFDYGALLGAFMTYWCTTLAMGIDFIATMTGQTPARDRFEGLTWGLYESGKRVAATDYLRAKMAVQQAGRIAAKFHETYDVWLSATLGRPPEKLGFFDMENSDFSVSFLPQIDYAPYTALQNATGQPAINLPLTWNKAGLPIGVQFVGRFGDELTLLKLAAELEKAQPWYHRYKQIEM